MGSGDWLRYNKGPTVEDCLTLDINKLVRDGLVGAFDSRGALAWTRQGTGEHVATVSYELRDRGLDGGSLVLAYAVGREEDRRQVRETVPLHTTRPHLGGQRWWFSCPHCSRRAAKLYLPPRASRFLCRGCYGLGYQSQRQDRATRVLVQARTIRRRLGGNPSSTAPFPDKPKGMHWKTYARLRGQAMRREMLFWERAEQAFI